MAQQDSNFKDNISFKKIRSKYILAQIFEYIQQDRKLNIIRYNKKLKYKLNIKMDKFKKAYSKIEIEIFPKENEYGRFIHIPNMKGDFNYHIYFDDNKEDIKRRELTENDKVKKIKVILNHKIKSLYE